MTATILDLAICEFWWQIWLWDVVLSHCVKFGVNICNNGPVVAKNLNFNMAAATVLDFWLMWILTVNLAVGPSFQPLHQIWYKYNYAIMADWPKMWFSTWRPPPSWILQNINFAGKTGYTTKYSVSTCQILWESVQKWPSYGCLTDFKMAAAAILDFGPMWILMVNLAAGPHFQPMYQIWCTYMQKWPRYCQKCDFQYGGRRHLGFCRI